MPNVVEIVVKGQDQATPALEKAGRTTKQLTNDMKALGGTLGQVGNVFSRFGASEIGSAVNSIEAAIIATRSFTKDLESSKLAIAGLGVAAAVAGWEVGNFVRQWVPFFNEVDKLEKTASVLEKIQDASRARLAIRDPEKGRDADVAARFNKEIAALQSLRTRTAEENELIFQLEMLRDETLEKNATDRAEREEKRMAEGIERFTDYNDKLFLQLQKHGNAELAEFLEVEEIQAKRLESLRQFYTDGIISADKFHSAAVVAHDLYEREKTAISKRQSEARKKLQREELLMFSNYVGQVGSIFGSLAAISATQGKKSFEFTQALRYAEAVVNTAAGVARAFAEYSWPYSMVVAAAVAAAGAAQIATIAATKPPQAHSGASYIPEESTYLLNQGERVLSPRQNEDLTNFLDAGRGSAGSGDVYIDGQKLGEILYQMSRSGRLRISQRAIV